MNAHEAVLAAARTLLEQAPAIAEEITRSRRRPLSEGVATAVNVYFGGSAPARGTIKGAPIDWTTVIRFECIARAAEGQTADQAALALHAKAWERLMSDQSLGGLASDLVPGALIPTDDDEADMPIGAAIGTVSAVHRTASNTLEPVT